MIYKKLNVFKKMEIDFKKFEWLFFSSSSHQKYWKMQTIISKIYFEMYLLEVGDKVKIEQKHHFLILKQNE